ncbi:hypothetical protein PFHG_05634 [Plasmodium falciparum HB3]|uniref:Uncharacterized protein n=1 Tax=Plasmodium falciparum (isolate HB3) TaxID=137071 RepID=A0A0L7K5X3_PLAFX|nr:hypothetical protein PFHG_05634 [Plasmodium falciparum HB3]
MENTDNEYNYNIGTDHFELLIKNICYELKKRDKNKNGLILYNSFVESWIYFKLNMIGPT